MLKSGPFELFICIKFEPLNKNPDGRISGKNPSCVLSKKMSKSVNVVVSPNVSLATSLILYVPFSSGSLKLNVHISPLVSIDPLNSCCNSQ
ncbi:hypothetical protein ES703_55700 [subsurface metagenome]